MGVGTNYGLNDSLKYNEFEFDSLVAQNSLDSAYYTTDWPLFILSKPLNNVAAIKVLEAQIPFSFYLFNNNNNTFYLNEWSTGGTHDSGAIQIIIPPGNYTSVTIRTVLGSALTSASASSGGSWTYAVSYDTAKMKLSISSSANQSAGDFFTLTFGNDLYDVGTTNPRLWLGFSGGVNTSSVNVGPAANTEVLLAPSVVQLTGPNYIYLCSRMLGPMVKLYLPNYSNQGVYGIGGDGPEMARISMTEGVGSVCNWQDPDPQKWFDLENLNNLAQVDFYCVLGNQDNRIPLDFNGNSFSLKLGILTNEAVHNDYLGGGAQNNRVVSRTWAVGNGMQF